jgi:hypothetical protein
METLRFLNKRTNTNERNNFNNWWREQISIYGQDVMFYSNGTTLPTAYFLYGEEPSAEYKESHNLIVLLNLNNDALILSKFGILADSDISGVIHPHHFEKLFGEGSEPKAGDLISLEEYGSDRLHYPKRGPTIYELTEVIDEFQGNPLGGHYVWFFKGKRYDYSHELNGPGAGMGNTPVDDNDSANEAGLNNFDYKNDNPCSNPSVYGDY